MFDAIDHLILTVLQQDGRLSNVELAARVGLSPSPCLRRVRMLEQAGVITGYRAIIDRDAVGLALTVFVEITAARHLPETIDRLQESLAALPEVVSCHMVTGAADFLAEIVVRDLPAYERLLSERLLTLPTVGSIRSNIVLRRIKSDAPLILPLGEPGVLSPSDAPQDRTD